MRVPTTPTANRTANALGVVAARSLVGILLGAVAARSLVGILLGAGVAG